jgi:sulfate adenylyltransferase subunit 2
MTRRILTHLQQLEAESIFILREAAAEFLNPILLYSIGKDSSVLLHLARKAFTPARLPFPLLHIDTGWKFREMIAFRDRLAAQPDIDLRVWTNEEARRQNVNPFDHGAQEYTHLMKTVALRQALEHFDGDAAIGGARRDEEASRSKERIFSLRDAAHRWDPKAQRPELWNLYNTRLRKGERMRVFPLSNWTELEIWLYILSENIEVVRLYLAAERPVVERDGVLLMVDDERFRLRPGEKPQTRKVRFRTLGCYPLSGAIDSDADTVPKLIEEMLQSTRSERQGRVIDYDEGGSMEEKKREGYF